jgi:hypothetical protein
LRSLRGINAINLGEATEPAMLTAQRTQQQVIWRRTELTNGGDCSGGDCVGEMA